MPGFDENSAKRIAKSVKFTESLPQATGGESSIYSAVLPSKLAKITVAFQALSGSTLGKGKIKPQTLSKDQSTKVVTFADSPQPELDAYTIATTVTMLTSGKLVGYKIIDGCAILDLASC